MKPQSAETGFAKALKQCVCVQKGYSLVVVAGFAPTSPADVPTAE